MGAASTKKIVVKRFLAIFGLELLLEIIGYQGLGSYLFGGLWESGMLSEMLIHIVWMFVITTPILFWWITNSVRKEARYVKALQDTKNDFESLFTHSSSGIVAFDTDGYIKNCNPAFLNIAGYSYKEVIGRHRHEFVPSKKLDLVKSAFLQALSGKSFEFESLLIHKDGYLLNVESVNVPIYEKDETVGVYAILKDITDRKKTERAMWELAHHDHLTNLPNRRLFIQKLSDALAEAKEDENHCVGVLFLDLDRFKNVNDSLGHDIGDKLLREIGVRMSKCLKPKNLLARLGGDEFAVLLPNIHHVSEAETVVKCLIDVIRKPVFLDDYELYLTSSIGVAVYPYNGNSAKEILKSADTAMYVAKGEGKNQYRVHMSSMNQHSYRKLQLERDLRKALMSQNDELYVEYQPRIDVRTNGVVGAEALIRWEHSTLGRLGPDEFISLAEEVDLIQDLGKFVLQQVCQQIATWLHENPEYNLRIAVNVSPQGFQSENFISDFTSLIAHYNIPFELIGIEITETTLLRREQAMIQRLNELRALGIKVYVDDFGKGYSSLGFLKDLPLDGLKIDRMFVSEIDTDPREASIIKAMITLAHTRNLQVTAEGVERVEQLEQLRQNNCDEYQGFLHSRPGPPSNLIRYL